MAAVWIEVATAKSENRRELSLIGSEISERIERKGLDPTIFDLSNLNLLDISKTCLASLADDIGKLTNLTNLTLQFNSLITLPDAVGRLTKLKFLDISHNKIESLPNELSQLTELQSLNASVNRLTEFPDVSSLVSLRILNIAHNKLTHLPDGICNENLVHLSHINASNNELEDLPNQLSVLPHLNSLLLADNKLENLPNELCECTKLKELTLNGNKLKDRKLAKFAEQNALKQIMSYLTAALEKEIAAGSKKDKKSKPKKKKGTREKNELEDLAKSFISILRFPPSNGLEVTVKANVADVRPYIVCCVIREVNFKKSVNMFKRFIALQTRLHDNLCQKRQAATIATHDFALVKGPLVYTAQPPQRIMITPLFKSKDVSAGELLKSLRQEADALRKEKKRSTVSGIHKYLDLLKDKTLFPCLLDAENQVISFPPITNSEKTKISKETTSVLVEVTSSVSLDLCKKVLDALLEETLETGVGSETPHGVDEGSDSVQEAANDGAKGGADGDKNDALNFTNQRQRLVVEQVKVVDEDGSLKVLYPSRTDLQDDNYEVIRNQGQEN